jgi:hypothetical protein
MPHTIRTVNKQVRRFSHKNNMEQLRILRHQQHLMQLRMHDWNSIPREKFTSPTGGVSVATGISPIEIIDDAAIGSPLVKSPALVESMLSERVELVDEPIAEPVIEPVIEPVVEKMPANPIEVKVEAKIPYHHYTENTLYRSREELMNDVFLQHGIDPLLGELANNRESSTFILIYAGIHRNNLIKICLTNSPFDTLCHAFNLYCDVLRHVSYAMLSGFGRTELSKLYYLVFCCLPKCCEGVEDFESAWKSWCSS